MSNNILFPTTISTTELAGAVIQRRFIEHRLRSGHNVIFHAEGNNDVQVTGDLTTLSGYDFFDRPFTFAYKMKARGIDLGLDEYIPKRPWGEQDAFSPSCPEGYGYTQDVENAFIARLMMQNKRLAA